MRNLNNKEVKHVNGGLVGVDEAIYTEVGGMWGTLMPNGDFFPGVHPSTLLNVSKGGI